MVAGKVREFSKQTRALAVPITYLFAPIGAFLFSESLLY